MRQFQRASFYPFIDDIEMNMKDLPFIPVSDAIATGTSPFFSEAQKARLDNSSLPHHVALIPDGNRRWAKKHNTTLVSAYSKGAYSLVETALAAKELGIQWMTVYFFSTENWKRTPEEVTLLMKVIEWYLIFYEESMKKAGIGIQTIGDLSAVPKSLQNTIDAIKKSPQNSSSRFILNLAINYGGRNELIRAFKSLIIQKSQEELLSSLNETLISHALDTALIPDPELVIRASGEKRISNFLLWQTSYSEVYTDIAYWPDYSPNNLFEAILEYQKRDRRIGGNST